VGTLNKNKWIRITGTLITIALLITVGCTTEAEYLNARDTVMDYLGDKYPGVDFELAEYYYIGKAQTHQFYFNDSSEHQFTVLVEGNNIRDNYIDNLLKEEVTEIISGIVNESSYVINKAYVGGISYKSFEGLSVADCSEVGIDLMISGEKMSAEETDELAQFLYDNLKRDMDIKKLMIVYRYSDSDSDGYQIYEVTIE
jgi:hypothetical protein